MINVSALGHLEAETEASQGAGLVQSPSEFRLEDVKKIAPSLSSIQSEPDDEKPTSSSVTQWYWLRNQMAT